MLQINYVLCFILAFLNLTSAAVYVKASCPDVKAAENFNVTAFQGTWYQVARYSNDIEKNGNCVTDVMTIEDGLYKFKITEVLDNKLNVIDGYYFVAPNAGNYAIINIYADKMQEDAINKAWPMHFVAIDYDNYALAFECRYNEAAKTRHDYAWIWSRSKILKNEARNSLENIIQSIDFIDYSKFVWEQFTNESCKIKS